MRLPDQEWQTLYLDLGWGVVVAALTIRATQALFALRGRSLSGIALACTAAVVIAVMWLPAPWAPSFWLGMAFQHPSLLLVLLSGIAIGNATGNATGNAIGNATGRGALRERVPLLPAIPAASIVVLGAVLYAGAFAWIPFDAYVLGYWGFAATTLATGLIVLWQLPGSRSGPVCVALALAALIHALTRLPSGNAWDAILDPLLFTYAAGTLLATSAARLRAPRRITSHAPISE